MAVRRLDASETPALGVAGLGWVSGGQGEFDVVAQAVELGDGAAFGTVGVEVVEVGATEVLVRDLVGEHVPGGDQDRVFQGDDSFEFAGAWDQAAVAGADVGGVLGTRGGRSSHAQGMAEPAVAVPCLHPCG
jgi:hypothetical protein